jgi:hypothetical protein
MATNLALYDSYAVTRRKGDDMHWEEQRCHQCGQIIGTDCMVVITKQGIVYPDCWDMPHVFHESPTFAEILAYNACE